MFTKRHFVLILVFFLLPNLIPSDTKFSGLFVSFASRKDSFAQATKYSYRQYEDRKEGIVKSKEPVAGEKLVLISAAIENNETIPKDNISLYNLGFWLQDTSRVLVVARELEKSYQMEPLRRDYPAGSNQFSWPSEIPLYYKITIKDLLPLAKVIGSGAPQIQQIVPLVLYYKEPQSTEVSYSFSLIGYRTIRELKYEIYRSDSLRLVYSGQSNNLRADKPFQIRWHGKDQTNKTAKNGLYTLVVEARFSAPPGETPPPPVFVNCQFYHYSELLKSKSFSP
jgi:hypothetical protein